MVAFDPAMITWWRACSMQHAHHLFIGTAGAATPGSSRHSPCTAALRPHVLQAAPHAEQARRRLLNSFCPVGAVWSTLVLHVQQYAHDVPGTAGASVPQGLTLLKPHLLA